MKKLILGSASPRRKELLALLGYDFEVQVKDTDESYPINLPASEVAAYIAEKKALAFPEPSEKEMILTADTVVVLNNQILGKPENEASAFQMLNQLSGNTHQVYSAFCLRTKNEIHTFTDVCSVTFLPLSDEEILQYIQEYRPMDKAGSYGIQEGIGLSKISRIEGSFYTVMGLCTHLVDKELRKRIK